jgi:hypothetical protein
MLDLHALYNATGYNATLTDMSIAANIPANDGQSAAGVPIAPGAVLKGWGAVAIAAKYIQEMQLISQDQIDPINGEHWGIHALSTLIMTHFDAYLPFAKGKRSIKASQVSGAQGKILGYTIDQYPSPGGASVKNFGQRIILPQTLGAATSQLWGSTPVAPTSMIPAGKYAILGAYVHSLTDNAIIRFQHADFGGKKPGFPVNDPELAIARAVTPMNCPVFNMYGLQFMALGDIPIFNCTVQGTGSTVDLIDNAADTATIDIQLVQLS